MKTLKRITVSMAIMSFIAFQGFSQNASTTDAKKDVQDQQTSTIAVPGKFVDNNKDGVCDNYQAKIKNGKCANFVDKNGDGICDNCKNVVKGKGNSNCCGKGFKNMRGQGKGNCCGNGNRYRHGCMNKNAPASEPVKPDNK